MLTELEDELELLVSEELLEETELSELLDELLTELTEELDEPSQLLNRLQEASLPGAVLVYQFA